MADFKRGGFGKGKFGGAPRRESSGPVVLHQAICAQCQKTCEVPFRPNGKKPVLCRDCFGGAKFEGSQRKERHVPRPNSHFDSRPDNVAAQIAELNAKIDVLTRLVKDLAN